MLDTGTLEWLRVTQAQQGQTHLGLACAVAGEAGDRRLWAAGYDTATTPRWLATLKAYAVDGTTAIDVPTYVGEADLGAFWSDVASDPAGNVIVVGATAIGAGENDYAPVVRKLDPDGATLWTRALLPAGSRSARRTPSMSAPKVPFASPAGPRTRPACVAAGSPA